MISLTVKVPFVILFPERSGSTFLVSLLKSHPEIKCYSEIFSLETKEDGQRGRSSKYPTEDDVYQKLNFVYSQSEVHASGFKFKYLGQVEHYPEVTKYLLSIKDKMSVILLQRKNLLKAAVSKQNQARIFAAKGVNNIKKDNNVQVVGRLELNINKAIRYMEKRKVTDDYYHQQVSNFGFAKVHHLWYEDLVKSYEKTIGNVLSFLEVDSSQKLSSDFQKITNDNLEESLNNYDEVVTKLSGTEWSEYLFM